MFCKCKDKVKLLEDRVAWLEDAHGKLLKHLTQSLDRKIKRHEGMRVADKIYLEDK